MRENSTKKQVSATQKVINALDEALLNYGTDVVSVDRNEETGMMDINQCHSSWSDVITSKIADSDDIDFEELEKACDERHVGHCW